MKNNDLMIIYVLVSGFLIGVTIYGAFSSQKYKPDAKEKTSIKSVYDSKFTEFEWRGHKYLKYGNPANLSVLHDPDCPCITNKVEVVQ